MRKRGMTQIKAYFLIINIVLAIVAFSWLVSSTDDKNKNANIGRVAPAAAQVVEKFRKPPTGKPIKTENSGGVGVVSITDVSASQTNVKMGVDKYKSLKDKNINENFLNTFLDEGGLDVFKESNKVTYGYSPEILEGVYLTSEDVTVYGKDAIEVGRVLGVDMSEHVQTHTRGVLSKNKFSDFNVKDVGKSFNGLELTSYNRNDDGTVDLKFKGIDEQERTFTGKGNDKIIDVPDPPGAKTLAGSIIPGIFSDLQNTLVLAGLIYGLSSMLGADTDTSIAVTAAFTSGKLVNDILTKYIENRGGDKFLLGQKWLTPGVVGIGIGIGVFLWLYKKTSEEIVEFNCRPYQPPIGGEDCEKCNTFGECSEYRCKSLGQACELLNAGTGDEKCTWVNPHDVNSPLIRVEDVLSGYIYKKDGAVRPPATGVVISLEDGNCVEAFTPLEFTLATDEPAQCKIDYNLTTGFDEMSYYIGDSLFSYNHTESMSLPGPEAINAVDPELKNDGTYTLYARCQDANGNFNQDAFSVRFCVDPGPDTTPPRIEDVSIPSNSPIQFNVSELDLEVYVNEPAECKWSREDRTFDNMEYDMACSSNIWEMNNNNVYPCSVTLTGIESRKENAYYFRCKDKPGREEGDRNVNTQSYLYNVIGTQPLNIIDVEPNGTIKGATDTIPVYLGVKTDNGYSNGDAICYYSTTEEEADYLQFAETGTNIHTQRQDLVSGVYTYYYKCLDLGGNADYADTTFSVDVDRSSPVIVRVYKEGGLKIITSEESICSYSNKDCNFEIADGISMPYDNDAIHTAEWNVANNYYIRCKDDYENQPNPNTCSIVVRPYEVLEQSSGVIVL